MGADSSVRQRPELCRSPSAASRWSGRRRTTSTGQSGRRSRNPPRGESRQAQTLGRGASRSSTDVKASPRCSHRKFQFQFLRLFFSQFRISSTIHASTTIAANARMTLFMGSAIFGRGQHVQAIAVFATQLPLPKCSAGNKKRTAICLATNEWRRSSFQAAIRPVPSCTPLSADELHARINR